MQSFLVVLQKIIKSKEIIFSNNPKDFPLFSSKNYNKEFLYENLTIHHAIFFMMHKHNSSTNIHEWVKHKYKILDIHIVDNALISNQLRDNLLSIIFKSQKAYNGFARLANIYRYKKYKTVISDDLTLNPLDEKHRHTFVLLQNKCKYLFSIRDLINIVETALSNSCRFFAEPICPKNPYNNMKLNEASLYNIYFKMKTTSLSSQLFDMYYLAKFSLETFKVDNEVFLRDVTIKNYTYKSPPNTLRSSIIQMINTNPYTKKLKIHKDFPNDLLAEIFRPFLYNYLHINYTFQGLEKNSVCDMELHTRLHRFYNYNPNFGRKYIQKKIVFDKIEENIFINTNHINFYNKEIVNNIIDETCVCMLDINTISINNINSNQTRRHLLNENNQFILSHHIANLPVIEAQRYIRSRSQTTSTTNSRSSTPSHNDSPNISPTPSPTAMQNGMSVLAISDIYNQINNELSDDTLSETNEDISVS